MYGFKYVGGFDTLLTDESNPTKAGSISMEEPEYNPPFTHQEKYSVISNPSKAGSIYTPFFKEEPIIQRKFSFYLSKFANSSIDISDGIAQDLKHICVNSKCGALINIDLIHLSSKLKILKRKKKLSFKKIFSKGDDYQILFTSRPKNILKVINFSKKTKTKVTRIGTIQKGKNINHAWKK